MRYGKAWIRIGISLISLTVLGAIIYRTIPTDKPAKPRAANTVKSSIDNSDLSISLVIEYTNAEHPRQYLEGAREEAKRLGVRLEIMDAKNNRKLMAHMIDDAVLRDADGIMISHGSPEALTASVKRGINRGVSVVAFDCDIPVSTVTKIDQDDELIAEMGLRRILKNTGGTIDVVWATWDEFAKGAAQAIKDEGRTEIELYGIDVSNEDLKYLQDPKSPWIETIAVDPKSVAKVQLRMLVHAIRGEKIPKRYSLTPRLITKAMLPKDTPVTMDNLHKYVPGWGETKEFEVK